MKTKTSFKTQEGKNEILKSYHLFRCLSYEKITTHLHSKLFWGIGVFCFISNIL